MLVLLLGASVLVTTVSIGIDLAVYAFSRKTLNRYLLMVLASIDVVSLALLALTGLSSAGSAASFLSLVSVLALVCGLSGLMLLLPTFYHFVLGVPGRGTRALFLAIAGAFLLICLFLLLRGSWAILPLAFYAGPNGVSAYCIILGFLRLNGVRDRFLRRALFLICIVQAVYIPAALLELLLFRTTICFALFGLLFNGLFIIPTLLRTGRISVLGDDGAAETFAARYGITAREKEVTLLMKAGMSSADIAARLFVSNKTVETHITSIYRKTGARNRVQLLIALGGGGVQG